MIKYTVRVEFSSGAVIETTKPKAYNQIQKEVIRIIKEYQETMSDDFKVSYKEVKR
jgi:hypothetical protein